jgi:hypothetical protein
LDNLLFKQKNYTQTIPSNLIVTWVQLLPTSICLTRVHIQKAILA